jgi:hypothetical protein
MSLRPPPQSALSDLDANYLAQYSLPTPQDSKQFIAELRIPAHFRRHALVVAGTEVTIETTISFDHLLRLAKQGDKKALEALQGDGEVSGLRNRTLVASLAPDMIVTVGSNSGLTSGWTNHYGHGQASILHACAQIVPSDPTAQPRLRGTISFVYSTTSALRPSPERSCSILLWSRTNSSRELRKPSRVFRKKVVSYREARKHRFAG